MLSKPIEALHMIILMQPNLEAAIDFYASLGIKLIFHIKDRWAEMKLGDVKIGLCPTDQLIDGFRTGVVLQVGDLKKVYEEFKDKISFLSEPKEAVHGLMASFKDPGGNIIDLYQPTPEKIVELVKKTAETVPSDDDQSENKSCMQAGNCCRRTKDVGCS